MVKRATLIVTVTVLSVLAAFALLAATIAGAAYAADSTLPSTIAAVGVVLALATLLVAAMQRTHRRASGPGANAIGADLSDDRDLVRTRDELRAMQGSREVSPTRSPRLPSR